MSAYIVETFVTLAAVCALAVVFLWIARRLGVGRATGPIELCGHLPLDARRAIYLVRVGGPGGQMFIVGVGERGFTRLGEMPANQIDLTTGPAEPFGDVLSRVLRGKPLPDVLRGADPVNRATSIPFKNGPKTS
jgi:flagellar biogenesis protein FliO